MSPSGLAQTAPKETSGNTDFCYCVADRIAPRPTRFIYACTDTPICISSAGNVRTIWIFIFRCYYNICRSTKCTFRYHCGIIMIIRRYERQNSIAAISPNETINQR